MTYDMETTIQLPDEEDVDVYIEFEVTSWGSPSCGPSLTYPGDPPEPPEFDIIRIERFYADGENAPGEDITHIFNTLSEEYHQKIWELVFQRVCEIEQDRSYYDYED